MLTPVEVSFDTATGALSPATGQYRKHLGDLEGVFQDADAWRHAVDHRDNPLVYQVNEYKQDGSDLFFGTTTMQPGKVGAEYFMTRGHSHRDPDMGEVYCTQSGTGLLLLETRDGQCSTVEMRPGGCAFIPPGWAHRSINTGSVPLVFTWFCNVDAGQDYGAISAQGMHNLVVEQAGKPAVIANPNLG